jgi:hypothetical protein
VLGASLEPRASAHPYSEEEVWAAVARVELCEPLSTAPQL